jgi:hypothetical protein
VFFIPLIVIKSLSYGRFKRTPFRMAEQLQGPFEKLVYSPYYSPYHSEEDSRTGAFESTNFSNGPRTSMMMMMMMMIMVILIVRINIIQINKRGILDIIIINNKIIAPLYKLSNQHVLVLHGCEATSPTLKTVHIGCFRAGC